MFEIQLNWVIEISKIYSTFYALFNYISNSIKVFAFIELLGGQTVYYFEKDSIRGQMKQAVLTDSAMLFSASDAQEMNEIGSS